MKKLSTIQKERSERLRKRRLVRKEVRVALASGELETIPDEFRGVIKIDCPRELSLSTSFDDTVNFFSEMKMLGRHIDKRRKFRPTTPTPYSIIFGQLKKISVRCAVMLSAELDRLNRISNGKMAYTGSVKHESEPMCLLRQMGCFDLLGLDAQLEDAQILDGHRTAIELISGKKIDDGKFEIFEQELNTLCSGFSHLKVLNGAMGEAILNVRNHAYWEGMKLTFPSPGKRWWATASFNPIESRLRIIVYDQGHGIGRTLPKTGALELIESYLGTVTSSFLNRSDISDKRLMLAAFKRAIDPDRTQPTRTRTGLKGRGKGMSDILKPVLKVPNSLARVASGSAEVTYSQKDGIKGRALPRHIGGTLIEWTFEV